MFHILSLSKRKLYPFLLLFCSLLINALYYKLYHNEEWMISYVTKLHTPIAYNFYKYSSLNKLYEPICFTDDGVKGTGVIRAVPRAPGVQDTIGYGLILGIIWKITGIIKLWPLQLLQILLFAFFMVLLYYTLLYIFKNRTQAFITSCIVISYLPLTLLNIEPMRNIWAFYGVIALIYGISYFLKNENPGYSTPLVAGIWFGICQWARAPLFASLVSVTFFLIVFCFLNQQFWQKTKKVLFIFWITNSLVFWIPWMTFNKITYNRYTVGILGQDLLESLGEYPNKWGAKLSDEWVDTIITQKYGKTYGTPEFDDKAQELFWIYFKEDPWHYFKSLLLRLKQLPFLSFPFCDYTNRITTFVTSYGGSVRGIIGIIKAFYYSDPFDLELFIQFLLFFILDFYRKILMIFSWLGVFYAFYKRQYLLLILFFGGGFIGGWGMLLSHYEPRYMIAYYGILSVFAGYLMAELWEKIRKKLYV